MSRVLPVSDRQSCNHAYIWLILGFICTTPCPGRYSQAKPPPCCASRGSNTIGAKLGPALVSGLFESQGMSNVRIAKGAENEQSVLAEDKLGRTLQVNVAAHGSGTGFVALQDGSAELAASSRPIKDVEAATLQALGDIAAARPNR